MKKVFLWSLVTLMANLLPCVTAWAQKPAGPDNLKSEVYGHRVTLSWENPDWGETLLSTGFELEGVPVTDNKISLETDGWTVKMTNMSDYSCSWFRYPTSDFIGADNYDVLVGNGQRSAVVFLDIMDGDDHDLHQDEWLISPVLKKAAYLEFSYYIDPRVVENGVHPEYPDHYVVIASTDGGKTWSEPLWDARYDASTEDSWHTVTLTLADVPADSMRVAFRAYGEYQLDENGDTINQSLYATWAIDDVTIRAAGIVPTVKTLSYSGFEEAESDEDISFEADGWTVKTTNDYEMTTTWFKNPVMEDDETFPMMVVEGERSAMVWPDEAGIYQDEWLISPELTPEAGQNLSMRFSYKSNVVYMDEEDGFIADAEGHYVVVVSRDGGETWEETPVWDLLADDEGTMDEEGMFYQNTVTVNIDAAPSDKIKVAFRAYGDKTGETDEETGDELGGLGGVWVVDEVFFLSAPVSDGHASLISHFKVALDGKELADHVTECGYVDKSEKTPGKHIYTVSSVAMDGSVSEPVSTEVTLAEIAFAVPRNFTCTSEPEETGKYTVRMTWDAPETDFQPAYYTVYSDNVMHGTGLTAEQGKEGIGISGCFGLYEFSIEAVYEIPDGISERVKQRLALGVRYGVVDLKAETEGKDVVLSWEAPEKNEYTVASYTVYRNGEKLTEGLKETTWRDVAVADGLYEYVVIVVYTDGVESVRTGVSHQVGDEVRMALPYEEHFNTTFLPVNWRIENQTDRTPDKYTWFFDDQSRLGVKGPGFEGCYAAIDCRNVGYYRLNTTLALPAIDLTTAKDKKNVGMSFYYSYAIGGIFKAGVEFSLDGKEWNLLDVIDKETGFKPSDDGDFHIQKADMRLGDVLLANDLNNADVIYLRFRYEATLSQFWAIDNVYVGEDLTAVEKTAEDMDVVVSAADGLLRVQAAQAIRLVEVYALDGRKLAERIGGETTGLTMPAPQSGPAIVRVTTAQGVKTVKIFL